MKLQGVISYNWPPGFNLMFLQDETGGIYVHPRSLDATLGELPAGTLVLIEGITVPGLFCCALRARTKLPCW